MTSKTLYLAQNKTVGIRRIVAADLQQIAHFPFTVSITEPMTELVRLKKVLRTTGFAGEDSGAVAIIDLASDRLLGTSQFYRAAPCIHGVELGYIIHDHADRDRGFASQAVRLLSDYLFAQQPNVYRQQLMIEVWNTASWKLAERCGFVREGLLRSSGFGAGDPADCFIYSRTRKDWHEALHTSISMGGLPA